MTSSRARPTSRAGLAATSSRAGRGPSRPPPARPIDSQAPRTCRTPPSKLFRENRAQRCPAGASSAPTAQVRERTKCGAGPSVAKPRPGLSAHPEGSQAPWGPAARQAGRGGVSGQRRPAGRGATEVGGSSGRPGPAPEPLPGLARRSPAQERVFQIFSSRITMAARWDRSPVSRKMFMAAAVGAVAPALGGSGGGGGGPREEATKMARAGATWPGTWPNCRRKREAVWESGPPPGPAPSPPLKGHAPRADPAGTVSSWVPSRTPRILANFSLLRFRLLLGCQRFLLIFETTLPCERFFASH